MVQIAVLDPGCVPRRQLTACLLATILPAVLLVIASADGGGGGADTRAATGVSPASSSHSLLPDAFAAARSRALGDGDGAANPCSLAPADGRQNFFLWWPMVPDMFDQLAYSALESVLFQHPSANVAVISAALPTDLLDRYIAEGYCAVSIPFAGTGVEKMYEIFDVAAELDGATPLIAHLVAQGDASSLLNLFNLLLMALQVVYGGVSLPMDGLLLNPFDFMLPKQLSLPSVAVFVERLSPTDGQPDASAMEGEDFDRSWLPRARFDRSDGYTFLCLDSRCPRAVPAGSNVGRALLQTWLQSAREVAVAKQAGGDGSGLPEVDAVRLATTLYRLYVRQRPAATPFDVDGFTFNHEMLALPDWVIMDSHSRASSDESLIAPRPHRESADWVEMSTSKLWLPLRNGSSFRNIMPRSVADLALHRFTLGIMPRPYYGKSFGVRDSHEGGSRKLYSEKHSMLPGAVGGFRTFRHIRLVGRDSANKPAAASAEPPEAGSSRASLGTLQRTNRWRVRVDAPGHQALRRLVLHCRREHRPISGLDQATLVSSDSVSFRACEAALQHASKIATANLATSSTEAGNAALPLFDACGTPAELNAALTLLAYAPLPGLGKLPANGTEAVSAAGAILDMREDVKSLKAHFADLRVTAVPTCDEEAATSLPSMKLELTALLDDVEDHITVVAHCTERCNFLDRLANSFRDVYSRLAIVATCECTEKEHCPEPVAAPHATIPGVTVISVPHNFGLSRGKSLLASLSQTEFVLVLEGDFVNSFHSCLECMLLRMRSELHSQWRPFDIVGFPILDDERLFGAFRGTLRQTGHQLYLDPVAEEATADGCTRVDVCPMVFLARTARLQKFKFHFELPGVDHVSFFHSNTYFGLEVAVCFDSSFPHFRAATESPQSMESAVRKYSVDDMTDYEGLLSMMTPPWYVSDGKCGPRASPPVPFSQAFVVVISRGDAEGRRYRDALRGSLPSVTEAASKAGNPLPSAWLQCLKNFGPHTFKWVFAVATSQEEHAAVALEQDVHRDILTVSIGPAGTAEEGSTKEMLRILTLLRDYQFRWLVIARQNVFVHCDRLLQTLQGTLPLKSTVLADWPTRGGAVGGFGPDPRLLILSRDVFALLTTPAVSGRLAFDGNHPDLGDLSGLRNGLGAWLRGLDIRRVPLVGLHFDSNSTDVAGYASGESECLASTLAMSPVTPEQVVALSRDPRACSASPK
eukprot:TRINITY_DN37894_c0_g1_i1.p1 TRINITY_DN37894_c0_g1~~TRINITY_DN37894_c0_g1_i1.p1  ORF type:complete len:1211 (+),score=172.41 TRINITY_DN37894_c0_g1_i1:158-3790(+)